MNKPAERWAHLLQHATKILVCYLKMVALRGIERVK
jgi:hypothetical protein